VPATVPDASNYGSLAALGDIDGDGLGDLAIGAPKDSGGAGGLRRGMDRAPRRGTAR
jgi:hypothetical protein